MGRRRRAGTPGPRALPAQPGAGCPPEVVVETGGFAFVPPRGWEARKTPDGAVLGHRRVPGVLLVLRHGAQTAAEMRSLAAGGLTVGEIRLTASGPCADHGPGGTVVPLAGTAGGSPVDAWGCLAPGPWGGGAAVLAVTSPGGIGPEHRRAVEDLVGSLRFLPPRPRTDRRPAKPPGP